jgi:hypothetical protein
MATKVRKGKDAERVSVSWGKVKIKVNKKPVTVDAVSRIQREVVTKLGLTLATSSGLVTTAKSKSGHLIVKGSSTPIGNKYLMVSLGEYKTTKSGRRELWIRVRVPSFLSAAATIAIFKKTKVKKIKWPNGVTSQIAV